MQGILRATAIVASLGLAGCGGGGSPVASTPAPPVVAPSNTSLTNLQYSQTFAAPVAGLRAQAQKTTGLISQVTAGPANAGSVSIAYNAAAQSYTLSYNGNSATFSPADRDVASSNAVITAYSTTSGALKQNFAFFNPGPTNTKLVLTYASYGAWQRLVDGASIGVTQDFFVFGIPTAASDLPRSGTAEYRTFADGTWASDGDLRALSGTSAFSADFGAGTTVLRLAVAGTSVTTRLPSFLDTFIGSGRIDSATASFSGTLSPAATSYTGSYNGSFFGPAAAEMGATFTLSNGTGGIVSGAVVGRQ